MSWMLKSKRLQSAGGMSGNSTIGSGQSSSFNTAGGSVSGNNAGGLNIDTGEDMVRQFAASYLDTQKKAFMRWVNVQLVNTPAVSPMVSIERDLRDGKRLIYLLEAVSQEPLKPEKGNMRIHQMANVSKALSFLDKKTDALGSLGNEDIVDGNVKLTLGLIWIIIYRFQIQQIASSLAELDPSLVEDLGLDIDDASTSKGKKKTASKELDAKQALIRWVRKQLEDYSDIIPPMLDFHRSWRNGLAFSALIHRHDPTFLPDFYSIIIPSAHETSDDWRRSLTEAFDAALAKMAIPKLLDPEDLADVETPDERSIMTYVSEYYLIMSKHQAQEDPALADAMRLLRVNAKNERLALAGEDEQAAHKRRLEADERKKREELEELERIRLRRMEIEGWSIRAAERAREEEEARRKRREEEAEKRLQRKLRREQREMEKAGLNPSNPSALLRSMAGSPALGSVMSESDHEFSDSDSEPVDPVEQEKRQAELDSKLAEYHEGLAELAEWVTLQTAEFPVTPDVTLPLDRSTDLEPFAESIKAVEEALDVKDHVMSHLHDLREELLELENPDLTPDQVGELDKKWWELETTWTELSNKIVVAKDTCKEMTWIVDCTQEIERVNGEILKFEAQLEAAAEKRSQEAPQDRCMPNVLEQQDVNLSSISFLIKTYVDFLTSLMDPKVHHYTAPEHLTARNNELTQVRLPRLETLIAKAQQNLSNDRLLRAFLDAFVLSEAWIGESVVWLADIDIPTFVSEDSWTGADTVEGFLARDKTLDLSLDFLQSEALDLSKELGEEQAEVMAFRKSGFAKLDDQAKGVTQSLGQTSDVTEKETSQAVNEMMEGVMKNLEKVEDLLPKEANRCEFSLRVLDYLMDSRSILVSLEASFGTISKWEMRQPDDEIEASVLNVESLHAKVETEYFVKGGSEEDWIGESIQNRHTGLTKVVHDLRAVFKDKQEAIQADRQMKEFLETTIKCQTILRELRTTLHDEIPMTGFGNDDQTPFERFFKLVAETSDALDRFENTQYAAYVDMGAVTIRLADSIRSGQDSTIAQTKLASVQKLNEDIKALRNDRKLDVKRIRDCQALYTRIVQVQNQVDSLETDMNEQEQSSSGKNDDVLAQFDDRLGDINNAMTTIEQDIAFRHLAKDPSCTELLRRIHGLQSSLKTRQDQLKSGLEVMVQWDLSWEQFTERAAVLDQYLITLTESIEARGISSLDGLADDRQWKKSEEELHQAEDANAEAGLALKEFQKSKMADLRKLAKELHDIFELESQTASNAALGATAGQEALVADHLAKLQHSESMQQDLKDHSKKVQALLDAEGLQLEIIGQRLVWSQQLTESQKEASELEASCKNAVEGYSTLLTACTVSQSTAALSVKASTRLQQQVDHLKSRLQEQKESRVEVIQTIFDSLAELAAVPRETDSPEDKAAGSKAVPLHLEVELYDFKNQYMVLDQHLDFAQQVSDQLASVADLLKRVESMDGGFHSMASELKAEQETSPSTLKRLSSIRKELDGLTNESRKVAKAAKAGDKVTALYGDSAQKNKASLESLLLARMGVSHELNSRLDPLIEEFKKLLAYQDGLRALSTELETFDKGINRSSQKVQSVHDQIKQMFSSWPGYRAEEEESDGQMVVFDVDEQIVVDDLEVLLDEMSGEAVKIKSAESEFQQLKLKTLRALDMATPHSKQLEAQLDFQLNSVSDRLRTVETDIRTKTLQLQCLDKRAVWEQEMEGARAWFKEFATAVLKFANEQARWKAAHPEEAANGSSNSAQLPHDRAATKEHMDQLGVSIMNFETQVDMFERKALPGVDRAWTELCSSLVFIARSVPDEFQRRQTGFRKEFEDLKGKIGYSAQVVTQRKSLEDVGLNLRELDQLRDLAKSSAVSTKSGKYGDDAMSIKSTKSKGSGADVDEVLLDHLAVKKPGVHAAVVVVDDSSSTSDATPDLAVLYNAHEFPTTVISSTTVLSDAVAVAAVAKQDLDSFEALALKMQTLASHILAELDVMQYPTDDSSEESLAETLAINEGIQTSVRCWQQQVQETRQWTVKALSEFRAHVRQLEQEDWQRSLLQLESDQAELQTQQAALMEQVVAFGGDAKSLHLTSNLMSNLVLSEAEPSSSFSSSLATSSTSLSESAKGSTFIQNSLKTPAVDSSKSSSSNNHFTASKHNSIINLDASSAQSSISTQATISSTTHSVNAHPTSSSHDVRSLLDPHSDSDPKTLVPIPSQLYIPVGSTTIIPSSTTSTIIPDGENLNQQHRIISTLVTFSREKLEELSSQSQEARQKITELEKMAERSVEFGAIELTRIGLEVRVQEEGEKSTSMQTNVVQDSSVNENGGVRSKGESDDDEVEYDETLENLKSGNEILLEKIQLESGLLSNNSARILEGMQAIANTIALSKASLDSQERCIALAKAEQDRLAQEEADRLAQQEERRQKQLALQALEESRQEFLNWCKIMVGGLDDVWVKYGVLAGPESHDDYDDDDEEEQEEKVNEVDDDGAVVTKRQRRVKGQLRVLCDVMNTCEQEVQKQSVAFEALQEKLNQERLELKDRPEETSNLLEETLTKAVTEVGAAWEMMQDELNGFNLVLGRFKVFADILNTLYKPKGMEPLEPAFSTEGAFEDMATIENRVEALRWMHWDDFSKEETALYDFMTSLEQRIHETEFLIAATLIKDITGTRDRKAHDDEDEAKRAIDKANADVVLVELNAIKDRLAVTRNQMQVIHETSKVIADLAEFHADLVRIEASTRRHLETVQARLGALERLCCFALNSDVLEKAVISANEESMEAQYQLSVLQEVEYAALERKAEELNVFNSASTEDDLGTGDDVNGQQLQQQESTSVGQKSAQDVLNQIRDGIAQLVSAVEADKDETLLVAKFYTHAKATEDIRIWITACRDTLAGIIPTAIKKPTVPLLEEGPALDARGEEATPIEKSDATTGSVDGAADGEGDEAPATDLQILISLEEKIESFSSTIDYYDMLAHDFLSLEGIQDLDEEMLSKGTNNVPDDNIPMRVILAQTLQERTKRIREDWVLVKEDFLAKSQAIAEMSESDADDLMSNASFSSSSPQQSRRSTRVSTRALRRLGAEIMQDIVVMSKDVQMLFEGGQDMSTLTESSISKLAMIEDNIQIVLQSKVDRLDEMLSAVQDEKESHKPRALYRQEKIVGVAMQRGLIAESMKRLAESCNRQRLEFEESLKIQEAMSLIMETEQRIRIFESEMATVEKLMQPSVFKASLVPPPPTPLHGSVSDSTLLSSSSENTLYDGVNEFNQPVSSPRPKRNVPERKQWSSSTAIAHKPVKHDFSASAAAKKQPSPSAPTTPVPLATLNAEELHEWGVQFQTLVTEWDQRSQEVEQRLSNISVLADRLNDWRVDEKAGGVAEYWQRIQGLVAGKKRELETLWNQRPDHPVSSLSSSRSPLMRASRGGAVPSSPLTPKLRQQRLHAQSLAAAGGASPVTAPTANQSSSTLTLPAHERVISPIGSPGRAPLLPGRSRASTAPGPGMSPTLGKRLALGLPGGNVLSPTLSTEARRRPTIRRMGSNSSMSSMASHHNIGNNNNVNTHGPEPHVIVTDMAAITHYNADPTNQLDMEVAKVVNASGLAMKVQKLRADGSIHHEDSSSGPSSTPKPLRGQGGHKLSKSSPGLSTLGGSSPSQSRASSNSSDEVGRYIFGELEPKICYCRILRSRKVMVRVGGGWTELSKFMEDHASLERRRARANEAKMNGDLSRLSSAGHSMTSLISITDQANRSWTDLESLAGTGVGAGDQSFLGNVSTNDLLLLAPPHQHGSHTQVVKIKGGRTASRSRSRQSSMHSGDDDSDAGGFARGVTGSTYGGSVMEDFDDQQQLQQQQKNAASPPDSSSASVSGSPGRTRKPVVIHLRPSDDLSLKSITLVKDANGESFIAI